MVMFHLVREVAPQFPWWTTLPPLSVTFISTIYLYGENGSALWFVSTRCRQTGEWRVGADVVSIIKECPPRESVLSVAVSQPCGRMTVFGVKVMACPVGVVFKATNQTNYYLLPRSKRIIPWWIRQKPVEV